MHPPGENIANERDEDYTTINEPLMYYMRQIPAEGAMIYLSTGERVMISRVVYN